MSNFADKDVMTKMTEIDLALKVYDTKSQKRQILAMKKRIIDNRVGTNITVITRALKAMQLKEKEKEKEKEKSYINSGGLPPGTFFPFFSHTFVLICYIL